MTDGKNQRSINRRLFLKAGSVTLAVAACGGSAFATVAQTEMTKQDDLFLQVSCFLCNRANLKPELAMRARRLILGVDNAFDHKVENIDSVIKTSGASDIDSFLNTAKNVDNETQDAILAIVTSWYLGVSPNQTDGHPGFITFTSALMYEPTQGITNPPTYAHAGTNYWETPPSSVKIPPMPEGIKEWGNRSPKGRGQIPGTLADGTLLRRPIGLDLPLNPYGNETGTE